MARIDSYQKAPSPISGADKLIGTDSANNNETKNFTIQEISDFVGLGPYKVYTALLTQSGGDDPLSINEGLLTIGVTYTIQEHFLNDDFTNVGAPNNLNGTSFVATGTTPAIWTDFSNLIYNTGAPVVIVLENTIGNIWWTYNADGSYYCNSDGLYTTDKTIPTMLSFYGQLGADIGVISNNQIDVGIYSIVTLNYINDVLINNPIEIRVYN
jgi:hypothetical protein